MSLREIPPRKPHIPPDEDAMSDERQHCPECLVHYVNRFTGDPVECPGLPPCAACAAKDAELAAIKEFTTTLAEKRFAVKDGYTLIDFLKLWLEQARDENAKKDAEIATLTARVRELEAERDANLSAYRQWGVLPCPSCQAANERAEAAEAERDRIRDDLAIYKHDLRATRADLAAMERAAGA